MFYLGCQIRLYRSPAVAGMMARTSGCRIIRAVYHYSAYVDDIYRLKIPMYNLNADL